MKLTIDVLFYLCGFVLAGVLAIPTPFVPQSVPHTDKSHLLPAYFNRTSRNYLSHFLMFLS